MLNVLLKGFLSACQIISWKEMHWHHQWCSIYHPYSCDEVRLWAPKQIASQSVLMVCIFLTFIQMNYAITSVIAMFQRITPRWRYEVVPQVQRCFQLLLEFTRSWNVFKQHCPQLIWILLIFPFQGPLYCPPSGSTFQGVLRRVCVISVEDFTNSIWCFSCLTIFLVLESNLIFRRSCLFKSNYWNEIREMSVLENILKIKLLWSKIQHTSFKYAVL